MLGTIAGDHACIAAGNWNWPAQGIWLRVAAPARACVSPSALLEADTPQSAPGNFNVVRYDCQRLRRLRLPTAAPNAEKPCCSHWRRRTGEPA